MPAVALLLLTCCPSSPLFLSHLSFFPNVAEDTLEQMEETTVPPVSHISTRMFGALPIACFVQITQSLQRAAHHSQIASVISATLHPAMAKRVVPASLGRTSLSMALRHAHCAWRASTRLKRPESQNQRAMIAPRTRALATAVGCSPTARAIKDTLAPTALLALLARKALTRLPTARQRARCARRANIRI